jgi:pimeloyl-ACP methyl ester carboxylesterase
VSLKIAVFLLLLVGTGVAAGSGKPEVMPLEHLSALASADVLVDRMLSPVTQDRIERFRQVVDVGLKEQTVAPGREEFDVFVPPEVPEGGYGLLVFSWPGDEFPVPKDWWGVLARNGMIFVAPRGSGNDHNVFDRRLPLMLHAYEHAKRHNAIDPSRVFVGGFSGGSRVAQRVAMAYPDVFQGALLIGGSDPVGTAGFVLPSAELTRVLQRQTRFVFSTGSRDLPNRAKDSRTRDSMSAACFARIRTVPQPQLAHWVPSGRNFQAALEALESPIKTEDAQQEACEARLGSDKRMSIAKIRRALDEGKREDAVKWLLEVDARYGGLAYPESVQLSHELEGVRPTIP